MTDVGQTIVERNDAAAKLNAVLGVDIFRAFFERYQDTLIPSQAAALDFIKAQGIPEKGAASCLEVILTNGRQVGLIQEISGKERIISAGHALEELSKFGKSTTTLQYEQSEGVETSSQSQFVPSISAPGFVAAQVHQLPTLHIDIQIHISADAEPEQIDQIFASMAKHLYHKGE